MKPAKSWICYFSPTGTSRRVAEAVGRGLNCAQTVVWRGDAESGAETEIDNAETPVYPNRACRGECEPCGEMIWR